MTGPIVFSDETARTQLVEEGIVVTFRSTERTTGSTWWRRSRTGEKAGDCHVGHIGRVEWGDFVRMLGQYVALSGFESVDAWAEAITELNGALSPGHLYRVTTEDYDE